MLTRTIVLIISMGLAGCATSPHSDRPLAAPQSSYTTKATPVSGDKVLITDSQDSWRTKNVLFSSFGDLDHAASDGAYYASRNGAWASLAGVFAAPLGANDNYLTDAQVTLLGNTSGANTGDQNGAGVAFADTDNLFTATNLQAAIEELNDSINTGLPNGTGAKVHWSQILGVPSVFADGTDDGPAGTGISHATADGAYYASKDGVWSSLTGTFAAPLGADDNYVTDAEKTVIGNTSGTNTGDQDLSYLSTKYVSGTEADMHGTLLDLQTLYDVDATNHAVTLITNTPAALTITEITVTCDADPTTELTLTLKHKTAGIGYGTPTTIEAITTVNGTITVSSGIDDATIPADRKVFAVLSDPDDALNECSLQIEADWD